MTITNLDKAALTALRAPIEAELKALGERLGLSLLLGSGTFGDGAEASFKLIMKVDDPATKAAAAKANWDRNCRLIGINFDKPNESGLRPDDLGTEFRHGRTTYRTADIAVKGRGAQKFPIIVEVIKDDSGKYQPGKILMLGEQAVPFIRAATDAKAAA